LRFAGIHRVDWPSRCGYLGEYAVVESLFHMGRPRGAEPPGF